MKKQIWVCSMALLMVILAACGTNNVEAPEVQSSGPDTYSINMTSMDNGTGSDYEISDMLPRPSDDTFVISLEDAEALMNNRGNASAHSGKELSGADESSGKSIVVYFSRAENIKFDPDVDAVTSASINLDESGTPVGNMRLLAEYIGEETGAVVFSIWTADLYPTAYKDTTDLAAEEKSANARPELTSHIDNMDDYDVIYLGYPIWWDTLPMPVASFLEEYDFTGKTIIPFASHEGSGLGSGVSMIKELCPDAEVLDGFAIKGGDVNTEAAREAVAEFIAGL